MTRSRAPLLTALLLAAVARPALAAEPPLRLWYEKPAATWVEALPIGNGRLGAMVFGDPRRERLALNEDTLWSGGPTDWNNPDAKSWLPKVREAVFAGRYAEADALTKKMQGPYNQSYQPLGDLLLDFDVPGKVEGYRRELDLDRAVATTTFRAERRPPHPRGVRELPRPGDRPPRERGPPRAGLVHGAARQQAAARHEGRGRRRDRAARPGPEPRRPELPRRNEGARPLRRGPGRRGDALHRDREGHGARGNRADDAGGPPRGEGGGRGRPLRLGRDELQRVRQVARARGPGRGRRGARPPRGGGEAVRPFSSTRTSPTTRASSAGSASTSARRRPTVRPTSGSAPTATARTPLSSPSSSSTAATCSSRAPAPAPSPRTCRASGTRTSARRGARTGRSTSTAR